MQDKNYSKECQILLIFLYKCKLNQEDCEVSTAHEPESVTQANGGDVMDMIGVIGGWQQLIKGILNFL